MTVLYLTWGEVVTNSGIFNNQVLEPLKLIKQIDEDVEVSVTSGIPIVNGILLKRRKSYYEEMGRIKDEFALSAIEFSPRWIFVLAKWFHSRAYQFSFYSLGQHRFLRNFVNENNVKIIHCRGYHATRLAILVRDRYSLDYKIVFDTRGLFPEEGVLVGNYSNTSWSYRAWKNLEKSMLNAADVVVNVSETFSEYIKSITDNPHIHTVYTSTNVDIFKANSIQKKSVRKKLNIADGQKILVYLGSIDVSRGWHRISNLISVFRVFRQAFPETKLLVITRSSHEMLRSEFDQVGLVETDYILVSANSAVETSTYLQGADYAVLPYRDTVNEIEEIIGYTMVASKTGEYFAAGLPLIVNQAVGAASRMVRNFGVGCTYKAGDETAIIDSLRELDCQYDLVSKQCTEVARNYFDANSNAEKYINIYKGLLSTLSSTKLKL